VSGWTDDGWVEAMTSTRPDEVRAGSIQDPESRVHLLQTLPFRISPPRCVFASVDQAVACWYIYCSPTRTSIYDIGSVQWYV
jgi:hypothetical protein